MQTQTVLRILVADPDTALASLLEESGFEVTSVRGGTSALERGAERQFDIFLIHYALSDLNGGIVVDNLTQYPCKKRPLIILYSRDCNPQLKQHSEGRFPADVYVEGEEGIRNIPVLIAQKLSGQEIRSKFVEIASSPSAPRNDESTSLRHCEPNRHCERSEAISRRDPSPSAQDDVMVSFQDDKLSRDDKSFRDDIRDPGFRRDDKSFRDDNDASEELSILSRELEIAHREINEVSSRLVDTTRELKDVSTERDRLIKERDDLKMMLPGMKKNLVDALKRSKAMEEENRELRQRYDNLRERAKEDLKKLKEREEKFASRALEIKQDAEKLMQVKDQKILLLKREFEELQFELERRGEKLQLSKERIEYWKQRVGKVTKALKVAMNVLENEEGGQII